VAVEHIGSTAVPGLGAKPIIDIQAAVNDLKDVSDYMMSLQRLEYEEEPLDVDFKRFFVRPLDHKQTRDTRLIDGFHLHFLQHGTARWQRPLQFRDYLRAHPEVAQQYHDLKQELAAAYNSDRMGYTWAKVSFVNDVLTQAEGRT